MSNENVLYETDNYVVESSGDVPIIGEDGNYAIRDGYIVVNRATNQIECTSMIFPQAIYQAQGFSDSVEQLTKEESEDKPGLSLVDIEGGEDVVPH